jgi:hypothetical protein
VSIAARLEANKSTITSLDAVGSAQAVSEAVVAQAKRQLN